jgi:hypothetical protein
MAKCKNTKQPSIETDYALFAAVGAIFDRAFIETEPQAQELFGESEYCSDEEFEIVFSNSLTHSEKVTAVRELRRKTLN